MAKKLTEKDKKNLEFIEKFLKDNDITYSISDNEVSFDYEPLDNDEKTWIECAVTLFNGTVLIKAATKKEVPSEDLELIALFENAINNYCHYTTLAVSTDMRFHAKALIDTNRADLTKLDLNNALFDVQVMINACTDPVDRIIAEGLDTEEAFNEAYNKILEAYDNCITDDIDNADDEPLYDIVESDEYREEFLVEISNHVALCSALEKDSIKELSSLFTEDVELAHFGRDKAFSGKVEVIRELRRCGFANDLHIAMLEQGEKQEKGLTPFKEKEACIIGAPEPERICFITSDEESRLINGIYFDSAEGYNWTVLM